MSKPEQKATTDALGRLYVYLQPYRLQLLIVIAFVIISTLLSLVAPYLIGVAIDDFIAKENRSGLINIVLALSLAYLGTWLSQVAQARIMAKVAQQTLDALRYDLFSHLQELSISFFDSQPVGDLMSRLINDTDAVNVLLSQNLIQLFIAGFTLVGILFMMFFLNVWLALASLIVMPFMVIVVFLVGRQLGPRFRRQQEALGDLNGLMEETLSGQRVVIAYGQQLRATQTFDQANQRVREAAIQANQLGVSILAIVLGLTFINIAVVVGTGAYMAIIGVASVSAGLIATFMTYSQRIIQPLLALVNLYNVIVAALAGAERIFEVMDEAPSVQDLAHAEALPDIQGSVAFTNVDFGYGPDSPVLHDNTFTVKPGEIIGLCGPTGAGKSTLINVLTRFYDIHNGAIAIDGIDIRTVTQESLRRQIGVVLQTPFLFSDTVMNNIRYGRLDATAEECMAAAQLANANGFIERLPQGYMTMLTEQGGNLSQGQRQLLTIARAILADPSVLILDEATSSVDTRTEKQIQDALHRLMKGRTSFVIAHRLSTIRDADQILVVRDGRILEQGNHSQLVAQRGFYYELFMSQFST
ncbi:MAG: ABC transporter ATP-binding protein [Chloroflexota bacterium]